MHTQEFLNSILGGDGYICVFGANPAVKRVIQKLYPTVADAYSAADNLKEEGFDAYFGLARFIDGRSRRADNVRSLKSFFLDIDCGPHKDESEGYPGGQGEGLAALKAFCKNAGLPKPTLVNSGRGIHAYWPLTEPVPPEEWIPVAEALKRACAKHGLKADPAVTADCARVLRVPDTLNFKDNPPREVGLLGALAPEIEFTAFRDALGTVAAVKKAASKVADVDDVMQALLGNYQNSFKKIMMKTAAGNGCGQLKKIVEEQESISEPLWRGGLSITKFCVDGEKAAHRISSRHPGYDPDATREKLEQIKGPYTCETFDKLNPGVCDKCAHKATLKSPIVLGREVQESEGEVTVVMAVPEVSPTSAVQTYTIPVYPKPYFRGHYGGVFKRSKDKDGDQIEIPVYHNDIYVIRRLHDPEIGEALVIRLHLPKDGVREFTIPLSSMLSKDDFRKYMAMNGVAVIKMDELMTYMTSWVNKLQAEIEADIARRQFGWTSDEMDSFVVGNKEIKGDRIDHNPPSNSTVRMFGAMQPRGTLEEWVEMANFFNRPGMEMSQYVVGMSFGSPLVAFSSEGAAIFHMYSKEPGIGKTTAMKVGASIWGNPNELMSQERDTFNSKMNRAEMYKNIFMPIDELTNVQPKDASDFLYQLTGLKQRNRMGGNTGGNSERYRGTEWKLNACSTGNTSLIARVTLFKAMPKAESVRVLEHHAMPFFFESKTETDLFGRKLASNYGHACIPFMQFVIRNLDEVRELFFETQKRIDDAAGLSQPHRFWSIQAASSITGLIIAKRLKLVDYNIAEIFDWIVLLLKRNRDSLQAATTEPQEVLSLYLAENYNNILRIRSTDDARSDSTTDTYIVADSVPRLKLVARYEYDLKRLYLIPKPFKEWCGSQQIDYADVVAELKKGKTQAVMRKQRLGKGTRMNLPPVDCLVMDCSAFMTDDAEDALALPQVLRERG